MNSKTKIVRRAGSLNSLAGRAGSMMELLETRQLLAAVSWDGEAGDNLWTSPNNWSNNMVPVGVDDVTIDVGSNPTIRLTNGVRTVNSLLSRETIQFEGGSLAVNTTAQFDTAAGIMRLQGGTLIGGAYSFTGGASVVTTSSSGTLTNVALGTELVMNVSSANVVVTGTTTFTAARLQASGATIYMAPGYTLSSLVSAEGAAGGTRSITMAYGGVGTVTIAPAGIIRLASGSGGNLNISNSSAATLVNNGLISSETTDRILTIGTSTLTNNANIQVTGGTLTITPNNWTNTAGTGNISATGGSSLRLQGAWSNAGLLNINASTLGLEGTFSTSGFNFPGFTRTGGTVNIVGTMNNTGSTLALNAATGSWTMLGGTINDGSVTYAGGSSLLFSTTAGTLNSVAVAGELLFNITSADVILGGNTTFTAARLQANAATIYMAPGFVLSSLISSEGAATGTRTITMAYGGVGTVTIAPSGIIRLAAGSGGGLTLNNSSAATLVNNGLISAEATGQTLTIGNSTFTNNANVQVTAGTLNISPTNWSNTSGTGNISATGGSSLRFQGAWTNGGLVNINASTLGLEGTFSTAGFNFPGFTRTGGTVNIVGTMTNTGNTLALNAATGSWAMLGGTITGGSVTSAGGSTLLGTTSGGTLNNVAVVGDLILNVTSSYFILAGTTTFSTARLQANNAGLYVYPGFTLDSQISVEGAATGNRFVTMAYTGVGTMTIGATGVVRIAAGAGGGLVMNNSSAATLINNGLISNESTGTTLSIQNSTFTNNASGTVQALAGTVNITPTNWTNAGTIRVATGAIVNIDGAFNATGGVGTFINTGSGIFNVVGAVNNAGNTITLTAATGSWTMRGGSITGGSMNLTGGSSLLTTTSGGTINNLAITGEVLFNVTSSSLVHAGTTTYTAARLQANNAGLYFATGATLNSLVVVEGAAAGNRVFVMAYGGAGTMTIAPGAVVRVAAGAGGGLTMQNSSAATLINNGLIVNEATGTTLTIQPSVFTNNASGVVRALAGTVTINATNWTNAGTIRLATGAVMNLDGGFNTTGGSGTFLNDGTGVTNVQGTITNTGNTITLTAATGSWTMRGGSIVNGSLNLTGGTSLFATTSGGTLSSVAVTGELVINVTSAYIGHAGTTTYTAARLQANNSALYFTPGATLNSPVFIEGATAGNRVMVMAWGGTGTMTIAAGGSVRISPGAGGGLTMQNSSAATLINNGLIVNDAAGQTLTIQTSVFTNNAPGIVRALAGTVTINSPSWTNAGTIRVATGAVMNLDGGLNAATGVGTFLNDGTGVTNVQGTITNTGNTITLTAATGSWTMRGGSIVNGALNLTGGTSLFATTSGGTLNNLAVTGELVINVTSAYIGHAGTTTYTAARLQANNAALYFTPGATLSSPVFVEGAAAGNRAIVMAWGGTGTMTIAAGGSVRVMAGAGAGLTMQNSSAATLINNGLISNEAAGQTLTIQNSVLTNNASGIVQALAGTTTVNNSSHTNAGTFRVATGAVFNIDGNMDATGPAGIGTLVNLGTGVFRVQGNITNTGKTIALNASTGSLTMGGGSIVNGALTTAGGASILGSSSGGALNNLAVTGDLLMIATSSYVSLGGTTTFTAARLQGNNTSIYMQPGYTLQNLISVEGATAGGRNIVMAFGGAGTITFSPTAVVRIAAGSGGGLSIQNSSAATLINNGLIQGLQNGQTITIQPSFFTNNGTVDAAGSPINITAPISNIVAGVLSGGVWKASAGGSLTGSANLVKVLNVNVTLDGASTGWNALARLETINPGVTFLLGGGTDLTTTPLTGTFTNSGTLILGLGSRLAIAGNFVQSPGALIRFLIAGGNPLTNYGSLTATGTGQLAGALEIVAVNGYEPSRPDLQDIIKTTGPCSGTFSSATWPQTTNPEWETYFYYTGNGAQLLTTSIIDFNIDGQIDLLDYFEFFNRWDVQDPTLDLNNDGSVDLGDYFLFFNLFDQG